ncbi:hypothetical protein LTR66_010712 [Elasticomyces elasticus]|nr:hypothetical protein LTR66_010712 [Elasticomyces elasticus]KAK5010722.1 hypothetical protein LTR28_008190 [Elasticomyces elasticus]
MASDNAAGAGISRLRPVTESAREREFYKYFLPVSLFSRDSRQTEPGASSAPSSSPSSTPTSSTDVALTAFAQLAALRLNARRAFISCFDHRNQYILAEATRTLSLQKDSVHDGDDALWLGATTVPRGNSACEHVAELPLPKINSDTGAFEDLVVTVITDLTQHDLYKNKPFVTDKPGARFYAGVPIRTSNGFNIGAFCVLDDEVRDGLTAEETELLKDMSRTVMGHLELVKTKVAHLRGQDMVRGLGSFIEGKSSLRDWWLKTGDIEEPSRPANVMFTHQQDTVDRRNRIRHANDTAASIQDMPTSPLERSERTNAFAQHSALERRDHAQPPAQRSPSNHRPRTKESSADLPVSSKDRSNTRQGRSENPLDQPLATNIRSTFNRAANIIREAIDVDGAMFLDASIGSFGGLVDDSRMPSHDQHESFDSHDSLDSNEGGTDTETTGDSESCHASSGSDKTATQKEEERRKICKVFASSRHSGSSDSGGRALATEIVMSERFLRALLRKYPHGKIWNFDDAGIGSSDEFSEDGTGGLKARESDEVSHGEHTPDRRKILLTKPTKRKQVRDRQKIQELFPGVRSLALVGLWDSHNSRWFAASVTWTYSPIRVLTIEGDVSYLAAFGDSIMAEVARLDVKMADRAKADFISSISHELRSPLHGILGSVECLQDTVVDAFQENMVHTVETCGKTLLDTIDHLLDFAKINNFNSKSARSPKAGSASRNRRNINHTLGSRDASLKGGMISLDVDVDLAIVTEEVIETVFAGYDYLKSTGKQDTGSPARAQERQSNMFAQNAAQLGEESRIQFGGRKHQGPRIILDFSAAHKDSHWVFRTQAGGWRRIVLNLFGNSLKYTETGFIRVKLESDTLPSAQKRKKAKSHVTLTITDSGKGISKDFMNTSLFRPFAQEDSLTPGTGLGLSIVHQIVTSMGGVIDVQSEQGKGTEIRVAFNMVHAPLSKDNPDHMIISSTAQRCRKTRIGFVGFDFRSRDSTGENSQEQFMTSLHKLCSSWFDMEAFFVDDLDKVEADLYLTSEAGAELLEKRTRDLRQELGNSEAAERNNATPRIVLCSTAARARSLQNKHIKEQQAAGIISEYIAQPCGPRKLAKALMLAFDGLDEEKDNEDDDEGKDKDGDGDDESSHRRSPSASSEDSTSGDSTSEESRSGDTSISPSDGARQPLSNKPLSAEPPLTHRPAESVRTVMTEPTRASMKPADQGDPSRTSASPTSQFSRRKSKPLNMYDGRNTEPSSPNVSKQTLSILLVDDNRINLQLLTTYMKKHGHTYTTAMDGLEALEAYKSVAPQPAHDADDAKAESDQNTNETAKTPPPASGKRFDYVLMDISMPVMDGLESTRCIRAHEHAVGLPPATIIALTGLASASAQQEAFSSGVDLFLTKPVRLKELSKILEAGR